MWPAPLSYCTRSRLVSFSGVVSATVPSGMIGRFLIIVRASLTFWALLEFYSSRKLRALLLPYHWCTTGLAPVVLNC